MILKKLLPRAMATGLAALAVSSSCPVLADEADTAYNENDILLFLQNPDGAVGNDKVVYYSLGSAVEIFRNATSNATTVTDLGNINSILNSTFGSDWTGWNSTNSSIYMGAAGQNGATHPASTTITNGDYARTVYVTKQRTAVGAVGQANSSSPLFSPSQTAVAGNIYGANNISSMTQPGVVDTSSTTLDSYNPFSNGNPSTGYGAISGGIQSAIGKSSAAFGDITGVINALDLYRITTTSGTLSGNSTSLWHVASQMDASFYNDTYAQGNAARADFLGTIVLTNTGAIHFVSRAPQTPQVPVLTPKTITGTQFSPIFGIVSATYSPYQFTHTGELPAGVSLDSSTGRITGTPSVAGNFTIDVTARNLSGNSTSPATVQIVVSAGALQAPVINSATTASGTVNTPFTAYTINATNSPTSYNATPLPAGLSVNTTTGIISGTPTTAGSTTVTLTATNSGGSDTKNLTITINSSPGGGGGAPSGGGSGGAPSGGGGGSSQVQKKGKSSSAKKSSAKKSSAKKSSAKKSSAKKSSAKKSSGKKTGGKKKAK